MEAKRGEESLGYLKLGMGPNEVKEEEKKKKKKNKKKKKKKNRNNNNFSILNYPPASTSCEIRNNPKRKR